MSDNNGSTHTGAFARLTAALTAAKQVDGFGSPTTSDRDLRRYAPVVDRLDDDQLSELIDAVEAGRMSIHELQQTLDTVERSAARSRAAGLAPAPAPLAVDLAALGEFDVSSLDDDDEPPIGAYVGGLFPHTGASVLAGPGGSGKTWMALEACRQAMSALYLDLDGNGPRKLAKRLVLMGGDPERLRNRQINLIDPAALAAERRIGTIEVVEAVLRGLVDDPPAVIVIDSFAKVLAAMGGSENDAADVNRVFALIEHLRSVSCCIVIDHTGHSEEKRPRGAAAKIDTPDEVLIVRPQRRGVAAADLVVVALNVAAAKDRNGALKHHLSDPEERASGPLHLGVLVVEGSTTFEVKFYPARDTAERERRGDESTEADRQRACAAALHAAGDAGMSRTKLAQHVAALGGDLALKQREAKAWASEFIDGLVDVGRAEIRPKGTGEVAVWLGDAPSDPDAEHAAAVRALFVEREDAEGGDANDVDEDGDE